MSEGGAGRGQKNGDLIGQIKVIQKKEQEQRQVLESFLAHFSNEESFASPSLLQNVIDECTRAEEESCNLWNENGKLKEKIAAQQNEIKVNEDKYVEELKRQENVFAKAQHDFNVANDDLRKQLGSYESELNAKNHTLRRLEDECSQLRIDAGQFESKLDSLHSEMASLDSAMASLHGELSVLQRELDESEKAKQKLQEELVVTKNVENTLSEEVIGLRQEKVDGDNARQELELELAESLAKLETMEAESNKRAQGLQAEYAVLQANFVKKDTKLKQQSATNQELNELVSKMHSDLIQEKQSHVQMVAEKSAVEERLQAEADRLRAALGAEQEAREKQSRLQLEATDRHASVKAKHANLQRECDAQANENSKQLKRIDRLEREKQDLLMEIAGKAQAYKDQQSSLDALKSKVDNALEEVNDKDKLILQMKLDAQSKEQEIRQLHSDIQEKDDNVQAIERQLNEERKLKEVSLEAARAQQREHASRIVESNQKCSRLGSDLTAAQSAIDTLKKQIIDASSLISSYEKEKEDMSKLQTATHSKLQALEDKYEECAARLEASDAELEDVSQKLNTAVQAKSEELEEMERRFNVELTNHVQKSKKEIDDLQESLKSTKKQAELNLERSLSRARNSFQRQLEELQTSHHREVSDARNRVVTVATAMEALQHELTAECAKSSEVMAELDMLRELTNNKSSGAEEDLARLEKDRTKERNNFESFIANLKNQVKSGNKTSSLLQQQLETATQQIQIEKEERHKTENSLRSAEEALSKQVLATEALESEVFSLKRQMSENDKKVGYQVQQKTDEIQRVTRRNEVLSEAVTRLTQMNGTSERSLSMSGMNDGSKYVFDDTGQASGDINSRDVAASINWGVEDGNQHMSNRGGGGQYDGGNSYRHLRDGNHHSSYASAQQQRQQQQHNHSSSDRNGSSGEGDMHRMSRNISPSKLDAGMTSTADVNSSLLRVQQALDSRRKQPGAGVGSANRTGLGHSHDYFNDGMPASSRNNNSNAYDGVSDRSFVVLTPERGGSRSRVEGHVPRLNFDAAEYEKEIVEDRTPSAGKDGGGLFAVRIRDEVEQGKDRLLPFSPKSASKQKRQSHLSDREAKDANAGCKTEREVRSKHVSTSKPDRALSAPAERMSKEK